MAKDTPGRPDPTGLDPREREILKSVIQAHIVTGEPVGSRTISKSWGLDLSPATIRNIMSDLEERGLLVQPHPSAGRLPTDRAYRLFVDRMMGPARVAAQQAQAIDQALHRSRGDITDLLAEACRQLSRFSHHVGVVLAPEINRVVVEHLEFVRLDARRVVAIVVDRTGVVHNRILEPTDGFDQDELDRIGRQLSAEYAGMSLHEIREAIARRLTEERASFDSLLTRGLELGRAAVEAEPHAQAVFVEGASNLIAAPEIHSVERARELLRALEAKGRLLDLIGSVGEGEGVQVVIGRENADPGLNDLTIVASPYRAGDRVLGTVGVVGPMRMEYARAIALVDHLARLLTRLLSTPGAGA
ncbi:MAG TPA: heat-inducible transcriptional repressor HrcA [Candidatus Polarisedimenticolaceae bacterium]